MIKMIKNLFQQEKIKKVPGLFKDEFGGKLITEFVALRPKVYAYLDHYGNYHNKSKGTRVCNKTKTYVRKFQKLLNNKNVYRSQRFKSHNKRLQTFDRITTYPYETNTFKVC